jgi:hypothetical protein
MSQVREPDFDRVVALVLRIGAFGCFFVMLAGLIDGFFMRGRIPLDIERTGVLLMLATPHSAAGFGVWNWGALRTTDTKIPALSLQGTQRPRTGRTQMV